LRVDGNAWLSAGVNGVVYVGDTNTDNVVFRADVDSNITPDDDITYDLGTSEQQWRELFVQDISATRDIFVDNRLNVSGHGTIGSNFAVSGNTTIEGNTVLSGTLDVEDVAVFNSSMFVTGDTTVEGNTVLSGALDVKDFTTLHDDLSVKGDLYVDGNAYLSAGIDGNIYVGDTNTDNVVFNADVNSSLIPQTHHAFNIGTDDKHWGTLYVRDVSANGDVKITDTLFVDKIQPDDTTRDKIDINAGMVNLQSGPDIESGSGMSITSDRIRFNSERFSFGDVRESVDGWRPWVLDINVDDQTTILDTTLTGKLDATFEQNLTVLGNTTFGTDNTDNVIFNADVDSNIIPDDTITYDLGTSEQQWRELFVQDISASNDIFVDNDLLVSANGTIGEDFRVSGHTTISGNTTLSGTLDVDDATKINDTLDVELDTRLHDSLFVTGNTTVSGDTHILGDLRVDGNAYLSAGIDGVINVGDANTDNVVFHADVDSGITPNKNITYDLGTKTQQWRTLYVQDISATGDTTIDDNLAVSGSATVGQDLFVTGNTTVSGSTTLSGTLDVDDAAYVHDTLDVELDTRLHGDLYVTGNTTVSGSTTLSGTLDVDDATRINDTLDVELDTRLYSDLYVTGNTTVSGNTTLSGTLDVDDATRINDTLDVELDTRLHGDLYTTGDTTISGNTTLSGTLDVEQATTIQGHISAVDGMTLTGDLTADDNVYIKGSIVVEGHAYFGFGADSSQINLGDPNVDEIIFQADVGSDVTPYPSLTYNLGSLSKRWLVVYTQDVNASGVLFSREGVVTNSSITQQKPPNVTTSNIRTTQDIWEGYNGLTVDGETTIETFSCDQYQSVQYNIMVKDEHGTSITTVNADFVYNGTDINGTVYGEVNVGNSNPLKDVTVDTTNNKYTLRITTSRYSRIVAKGNALYLQ
jgi:predicted acyltransferase (DUF342 family)